MSLIIYFLSVSALIYLNEAFVGQTKLCTPYDTLCLQIPNFSKLGKFGNYIKKYTDSGEKANLKQYNDYEEKPNEELARTESPKLKCKTGKCYTTSQCYSEFGEKDFALCHLPSGAKGVCCSIDENEPPSDGYNPPPIYVKPTPYPTKTPELSPEVIRNAVNNAVKSSMEFVAKIDKLEYELEKRKLVPLPGSQAFSLQSFFGRNPEALKLARNGLIDLQTAIEVAKTFKWSPVESQAGFPKIDLSQSPGRGICAKEPTCPANKYRTADGSCNNLNNKSWGKALSAFSRLLSPSYADGIDKPRIASDGSQLPSAREVSILLAPDQSKPNPRFNLLVMQFGQFLDHDLTRTAGTRTNDNNGISCCGEEFDRNPKLLHPACMQITIPPKDKFFRDLGKKCMEFVRSAVAPRAGCKLGAREQLNQLSAYIDGGMIYGTSDNQSKSLRSLKGGRLLTSIVNKREFLPFQNSNSGCSIPKTLKLNCFMAGDGRINEVSSLALIHAVFLKEHNRIADTLRKLNPKWNDEVLYQETRRIVIAELQHITYNEFLPIIIGRETMKQNALLLKRNKYSDKYSPDTDASILSGFATAAYRFHSMIPSFINLQSSDNRILDRIQLRDQFFDPSILYKRGGFESLINGLTGQPMERTDNFFSGDVTNHLFQEKNDSSGLDLVALNTQRGRDHGIPGYNAWRELCRLQRINNFEELESNFENPSVARGMSRLYRTVDDIDLFMAGVSEKKLPDSLVGPTFACIIGEQFRRIKEGDRFWFENGGLESSFSPKQLEEIKKTSLARILCDNSDVKVMQPLAMVQTIDWNPKLECDSNQIPRLDLNVWSDGKTNDKIEGSDDGRPNIRPDNRPTYRPNVKPNVIPNNRPNNKPNPRPYY